jgi:ABC-type glucose/galactose transport system permease subunit
MGTNKNIIGVILAISVIALMPNALCTEPLNVHSFEKVVNSSLVTYGAHSLVVESNQGDAPDLIHKKKSCKKQFAEKARRGDFWGMVRVGLFCPSTAYSY